MQEPQREPGHKPGAAELLDALCTTARRLLETAQDLGPHLRRSTLVLNAEQADELYRSLAGSQLASLLPDPGTGFPDVEEAEVRIVPDRPERAAIVIDQRSAPHSADTELSVQLWLSYRSDPESSSWESVRLVVRQHQPVLYRYLVFSDYLETGYEGHGVKALDLGPREIGYLDGLLERFAGPDAR